MILVIFGLSNLCVSGYLYTPAKKLSCSGGNCINIYIIASFANSFTILKCSRCFLLAFFSCFLHVNLQSWPLWRLWVYELVVLSGFTIIIIQEIITAHQHDSMQDSQISFWIMFRSYFVHYWISTYTWNNNKYLLFSLLSELSISSTLWQFTN